MSIGSVYCRLTKYQCADPNCDSGYNVEGHHIIPLRYNGPNKFWNIISLCQRCHRNYYFTEDNTYLFILKCNFELKTLGYVVDEEDPTFDINQFYLQGR